MKQGPLAPKKEAGVGPVKSLQRLFLFNQLPSALLQRHRSDLLKPRFHARMCLRVAQGHEKARPCLWMDAPLPQPEISLPLEVCFPACCAFDALAVTCICVATRI